MSEPITWQNIARVIADPTTIQKFVEDSFAAHNADGSAHGQSAEAIYNHRIAEILDHLDGSTTTEKIANYAVTENKIMQTKFYISSVWESIDSWENDTSDPGLPLLMLGWALIRTGAVTSDYSELRGVGDIFPVAYDTKNPYFELTALIPSETNRHILFGMGENAYNFVGFKVTNSTLYASIFVGATEHSYSLGTGYINALHVFKVIITSGVKAEFYIDNTLVYTESTYILDLTTDSYIIMLHVDTTANAKKTLRVGRLIFYQDL